MNQILTYFANINIFNRDATPSIATIRNSVVTEQAAACSKAICQQQNASSVDEANRITTLSNHAINSFVNQKRNSIVSLSSQSRRNSTVSTQSTNKIISKNIKQQNDKFNSLPNELLQHICYFFTREELLTTICLINRNFYILSMDDNLWWHLTFEENQYYKNNQSNFSELYTSTRDKRIQWIFNVNTGDKQQPSHVYNLVSNNNQLDSEDSSIFSKMKQLRTHKMNSLNCIDYFMEEKLSNKTKQVITEDKKLTNQIMNYFNDERNTKVLPRYRHTTVEIPTNSASTNIMIIGGILSERQVDTRLSTNQQCINTMNMIFTPTNMKFEAPKESEIVSTFNGKSEPLPRYFGKHSAVYCKSTKTVVVFGGSHDGRVSNDLYLVHLTPNYFNSRFSTGKVNKLNEEGEGVLFEWEKLEKKNEWPAPITNHSACMVGDRYMYVVGGGLGNNMTPTNEVWVFDVIDRKWTNITSSIQNADVFTPRLGFVMVNANDKLLCFGGGYWQQISQDEKYWSAYYSDLFVFDTKLNKWELIVTKGEKPKAGTFPAASTSLVGVNWYVSGGGMMFDVESSMYQLNTVTWTWKKVCESMGSDSGCLTPITLYKKNVIQTKLVQLGGYRYEPLKEAKVFSVHWKDTMDSLKRISFA
ncbi:hypothetical protein ABK040_008214 [Willaertia magna]